jgi:hypothetical protein
LTIDLIAYTFCVVGYVVFLPILHFWDCIRNQKGGCPRECLSTLTGCGWLDWACLCPSIPSVFLRVLLHAPNGPSHFSTSQWRFLFSCSHQGHHQSKLPLGPIRTGPIIESFYSNRIGFLSIPLFFASTLPFCGYRLIKGRVIRVSFLSRSKWLLIIDLIPEKSVKSFWCFRCFDQTLFQ